MGKRFGRQQKRKLKKRISDLEYAYLMNASLLQHLRDKVSAHEQTINRTARVLGEHFISLEPVNIELQSLKQLGDYYTTVTRKLTYPSPQEDKRFVEHALSRIEHSPVLRGDVQIDKLSGLVHYRFTFNGKVVGYSLTDAALAHGGEYLRDCVRKDISEHAARIFTDLDDVKARESHNNG